MLNVKNDEYVTQITPELEKLAIKHTTRAAKLREKKESADKLQRGIECNQNEIAEIQQRIRQLKTKRDNAKFVELPPIIDCNGAKIKVGALVEIVNAYTCFSTKHPKPRGTLILCTMKM